jgi:hypothetical protein
MRSLSSRFLDALKKGNEIQLIVKGRVTGNESSRPVWFVLKDRQLFLLPVTGIKTQWYKNIVKNPQVRITIGAESYTGLARPIKDQNGISEVVELFKAKYGASDVKKYYPRLDVAIRVNLA